MFARIRSYSRGLGNFISFLREFYAFLRTRKKYWLVPIMLMLVLVGSLVVLSQGSAIAPFIYPFF